MKNHIVRALKWVVYPSYDSTLSDFVSVIEIVDEGAGEYLRVTQMNPARKETQAITIDSNEWLSLKDAIENAFVEISQYSETKSLAK